MHAIQPAAPLSRVCPAGGSSGQAGTGPPSLGSCVSTSLWPRCGQLQRSCVFPYALTPDVSQKFHLMLNQTHILCPEKLAAGDEEAV